MEDGVIFFSLRFPTPLIFKAFWWPVEVEKE
jgi:hypothetical protein